MPRRKGYRAVPAKQRFWALVAIGAEDECWPFKGSKYWNGYGSFRLDCRGRSAHRVAYMFAHELAEYPATKVVIRHSCDNPPCCNPRHLVAGTQAENMQDMYAKNRAARVSPQGEAHYLAKLSEAAVRKIRAGGKSDAEFAAELNVATVTVTSVRQRRSWKHVE